MRKQNKHTRTHRRGLETETHTREAVSTHDTICPPNEPLLSGACVAGPKGAAHDRGSY